MKKVLQIVATFLILVGCVTAIELSISALGGAYKLIQLVYGL